MSTTLATIVETSIVAGTFQSGVFVFPATGLSSIQVTFPVNATDLIDPTKALAVSILVQQPNGSFSLDSGFTWQAGSATIVDKFGNTVPNVPTLTATVSSLVGKYCKVQLVTPSTIRVAVNVVGN